MGFRIYCFYVFLPFLLVRAVPTLIDSPVPSNFYTVAIFEHNRKGNSTIHTPSEIVNLNLDYCERATDVAGSKGADIIIFPEYGITNFLSREEMKNSLEEVPDPRKEVSNPCNEPEKFANRPMMYRLSCMAKRNNIVIVANTGDIQPCTKEENENCPDDGSFHFNANVAFDRDGTILAKYYKEHLFFEVGFDLPQEPQNPTFTTDFGTFAMFICFDTSWKPIADAARNESIDNIILSSMWGDILPLWNAVQWWEAFALGNNVTYLVSNANIPGYAAVGSGVFSGHMGALKYTFNPDGLSKLIISRAPKSKRQGYPFPNVDSSITVITADGSEPYNEDEDGKDVPEYCHPKVLGGNSQDINKDYRCGHENTTNYTFVKLTEAQGTLQACNNGMCCSLEYSAEDMTESYYLGVYNGSYHLYHYSYCEENCLLVRCDDFNNTICSSYPLKSNTIFHKVELRSNFTTKFVYPSVVKSGIRLTPLSEWTYGTSINGENNVDGCLKFNSDSSQPLLVAGLNGRCYDRDPPYRRWN